MIPLVINSAVIAIVAKVISAKTCDIIDASKDFEQLERNDKNLAIKELTGKGVPQKVIAEAFGISPPAVSQRLKRLEEATTQEPPKKDSPTSVRNLKTIVELLELGFTASSVASLLDEPYFHISEEDVRSFYKVYQSVNSKLSNPVNPPPKEDQDYE